MMDFFKVLIVDDEMLIRQGIINYIDWEQEGFKIIGEASNGDEALELILQQQPQIMFTDIVMPGMNGIELIKRAKELAPDMAIIVLSSFEDFEYVRQTFQYGVADYILKPNLNTDELLKVLHQVTSTLTIDQNTSAFHPAIEDMLKKVLEGYQSFGDIETLKRHFPYPSYSLMEFYWKDTISDKRMKEKIKALVKQEPDPSIIYTFSMQDHHLLLLINGKESQLTNFYQFIEMSFDEQFPHSKEVKGIISPPFEKIFELKGVYDAFKNNGHRYLFYFPEKKLIKTNDIPQKEQEEHSFHFDLNQMIKLFQQQDFQEVFEYLTKHIDSLSTQYHTDVFEYKSWLENIIFNIIVLLGNMEFKVDKLDEEKYYYFSEINNAFHVEEAVNTFQSFLTNVKELTSQSKPNQTSNMDMLLQYIDKHYNEPLSLKILADHFHFNPSYLSSYFSKHHREGFSDYLNHIRIEKACKLLKDTNLSISTISEKVGYSEPSYFTKVFKKLTNQSPRNYRKYVKLGK